MNKFILSLNIIRLLKNWQLYFADYFNLISENILLYKLRNGLKFKINSKSGGRGMLIEIFIMKEYNPQNFEINKKDIVVDIGANMGVFSVYASKKAKKVYSFEPIKNNYALLKENLILNDCKNVMPINEAVSDSNGSDTIFLSDSNVGGHSFFNKSENSEKVKTVKLADLMKKNKISKIDFLKIDTEGAEYKILYSCPDDVLKKIEKISMEYHLIENESVWKLKEFLERYFIVTIREDIQMLYAMNKSIQPVQP